MTQPRYELLNNGNQQEDASPSGLLRRATFGGRYDDGDDENEEIELGTEHRIRYESDDDEEECYVNGHLARKASDRDSVHNESGGVMGSPATTAHRAGSRIMHMAVGTVATILLYLALSISLTFYQQKLIKKLKFPLTIVTYHLVLKLCLAAIVRGIYKLCVGKTCVKIDLRTSWQKMAPAGIASGIDIGFSNWGLELVSISLYTMTKSSTIVFILIFAIMLGLEKKSLFLIFIVGLIAIGLFMFTYESAQFNALGFIFLLLASLSSGIRWSFAQFVMQKSKLGLHNPIDMIYYMQPWMIASLLPFLVTFEGQPLYDVFRDLSNTSNEVILINIFYITFGAVLAFLMECSEFLVLSKTSGLTLSIAGIFKDICQLSLGVEINGDQLSLINVFGLIVCLAGICMHLLHKYLTFTKMETVNMDEDDGELCFNETNISPTTNCNNQSSGNAITSGNVLTAVLQKKHSAQTVPLLEQSDSDDSNNDNEQNASDVIFDVLKRRDMQR
ncbi:solute carrier family 35 member C2 [Rhagoletis pomonella]|uniref:solute carrier family 35 member C2 n=1 Tax=Rhagoletis pomonella TaxID=28610 RepID=UPI00177C8086|nr:solute carrier family 35 member C2 [Rhagoletis pomonella]XP_036337741.1 solute carrier family 35 member C2 [Rhagoletis pomonella]XP_036337742.1 solute carrier family 35 member C2 [Rhagoletis pomonella]XP_036337743.1 solute carrier family 35 member C2 [Rhagoletis pomonella]XP_036337744.1 solute carrier family 35 member C2 [Rhagoletis pomonella]XP_036337745.1 solute carrier family 35 member C2 [Rhagoletis pomonella]